MSGRRNFRPRPGRDAAGRAPAASTGPRTGTPPGHLARRFRELAAAGPEGEAGCLIERALQAALADDDDALGGIAAEACADPVIAGVVITVLARMLVCATARELGGTDVDGIGDL